MHPTATAAGKGLLASRNFGGSAPIGSPTRHMLTLGPDRRFTHRAGPSPRSTSSARALISVGRLQRLRQRTVAIGVNLGAACERNSRPMPALAAFDRSIHDLDSRIAVPGVTGIIGPQRHAFRRRSRRPAQPTSDERSLVSSKKPSSSSIAPVTFSASRRGRRRLARSGSVICDLGYASTSPGCARSVAGFSRRAQARLIGCSATARRQRVPHVAFVERKDPGDMVRESSARSTRPSCAATTSAGARFGTPISQPLAVELHHEGTSPIPCGRNVLDLGSNNGFSPLDAARRRRFSRRHRASMSGADRAGDVPQGRL